MTQHRWRFKHINHKVTVDLKPLTNEEISEINARLEACTPGPWTSFFEGRDHTSGDSFIQTATQDIYIHADDYAGGGGHFCSDLDFIANSKQDIPRLIAEVERLRTLLEAATNSQNGE